MEIGFSNDVEDLPSQVVQLEHGENVRLIGHGLLDLPDVLVEHGFRPGMNFATIEKP